MTPKWIIRVYNVIDHLPITWLLSHAISSIIAQRLCESIPFVRGGNCAIHHLNVVPPLSHPPSPPLEGPIIIIFIPLRIADPYSHLHGWLSLSGFVYGNHDNYFSWGCNKVKLILTDCEEDFQSWYMPVTSTAALWTQTLHGLERRQAER